MTKTVFSPKELQERMTAAATYHGVPFGRLGDITDAQIQHITMFQYRGFEVLSDGWKCFFLETVETFNADVRPRVDRQVPIFHALLIERLVHNFQSLCAAEHVAKYGYPLQAYTLLRNIFDSTLLTAAAAHGITDFYRLDGIGDGAEFDKTKFRSKRRKEENRVVPLMMGPESGLSAETVEQLYKWDQLFNDETHGGRLSRGLSMDWLKQAAHLDIHPKFDETRLAMFLNRFSEVAWTVHRLLPLVQLSDVPFPNSWKEKWSAIDLGFRSMVEALTTSSGKPIGKAFVEFIEKRFPFDANSPFWC